jgi:alcohol oxidase
MVPSTGSNGSNRDTGRHSDAGHAYIHSIRGHHTNLHLRCNTKVDKVVIGNGVAVVVMAVPTKPFGGSKPKFYRARKLVIVGGGTISSHSSYKGLALVI